MQLRCLRCRSSRARDTTIHRLQQQMISNANNPECVVCRILGQIAQKTQNSHLHSTLHSTNHALTYNIASITGTHQAVLESLCHRSGIKNRQVHAYYGARRDNNLCASIEAELNHAFIKTAEQALELIYQPDFVLNTRMTKFLLADASFPNFVSALPNQFRRNLLNGARGNQYAAIAAYRHNFELLVRSQDPEMFPLER